jgi:hypothetical protein
MHVAVPTAQPCPGAGRLVAPDPPRRSLPGLLSEPLFSSDQSSPWPPPPRHTSSARKLWACPGSGHPTPRSGTASGRAGPKSAGRHATGRAGKPTAARLTNTHVRNHRRCPAGAPWRAWCTSCPNPPSGPASTAAFAYCIMDPCSPIDIATRWTVRRARDGVSRWNGSNPGSTLTPRDSGRGRPPRTAP